MIGRTRAMYAVHLQSMGQVQRFLWRNPSADDAFFVTFEMCLCHLISPDSSIPKYGFLQLVSVCLHLGYRRTENFVVCLRCSISWSCTSVSSSLPMSPIQAGHFEGWDGLEMILKYSRSGNHLRMASPGTLHYLAGDLCGRETATGWGRFLVVPRSPRWPHLRIHHLEQLSLSDSLGSVNWAINSVVLKLMH